MVVGIVVDMFADVDEIEGQNRVEDEEIVAAIQMRRVSGYMMM